MAPPIMFKMPAAVSVPPRAWLVGLLVWCMAGERAEMGIGGAAEVRVRRERVKRRESVVFIFVGCCGMLMEEVESEICLK
jgi:hypothetical protein